MHKCALLALSVECNFGKFSIASRDNERKREMEPQRERERERERA